MEISGACKFLYSGIEEIYYLLLDPLIARISGIRKFENIPTKKVKTPDTGYKIPK